MMKIWVVRQTCTYDNETYVTSHLTEKGALITAIKTVREDLCDGYDEGGSGSAVAAPISRRVIQHLIGEDLTPVKFGEITE